MKEAMLKAGWRTSGIYWWFEGGMEMDWIDARDLYLECL